jgi:hypothetical protein
MADGTDKEPFWSSRFVLALIVSAAVLIGIILFGWISITTSDDVAATAKDIFTFTLPVFGTWVATVLAYYFNKENLDAAARNVKDVLSMTARDRLVSISVKDKMIPKDKIVRGRLPADKIKFSEIIKEIDNQQKGDRYPVFDEDDKLIKYMIHKSKIVEYLADLALNGASQKELQSKTLEDMLGDSNYDKKYGELFRSSFGTVDEAATLMDAKIAMDAVPKCQDIFVTKGGKRDNEVVGWITSTIIINNSKV